MIFLTGATGFIGSHLAVQLADAGHEVVVMVRSASNQWRLAEHPGIRRIEGDLFDVDRVRAIIRELKPATVIHAAWGGATVDGRNGAAQLANFMATRSLFEICGEEGCRKVIGFGSQAEYGVHNTILREDAEPRPQDQYGVYKLSAGLLGRYYARHYGFDYVWFRLFSSFGPKDTPTYFLPYVIGSFLANRAPELTACTQQWDYLYVRDIVRFVQAVLETERPVQDVFNLASGRTVVLRDVVGELRRIIACPVEAKFGVLPFRPDAVMHLQGDMTRFTRTFGIPALTHLTTALEETVAWHRSTAEVTR